MIGIVAVVLLAGCIVGLAVLHATKPAWQHRKPGGRHRDTGEQHRGYADDDQAAAELAELRADDQHDNTTGP